MVQRGADRLVATRRGEELVAHGDREEDACRSPVVTAREATPVARGDREGYTCRSPVVTEREATLVALGDHEDGVCRSPVATAWEATPVARGDREDGVLGCPRRPDMSSRKKNSKRVGPRPSKFKNIGEDDEVLITPKEEFISHSVDPEEAERYWAAVCNKITPPLEAPFPHRLRFGMRWTV
ncbi:hypothetical protein HID58_079467 [Brassica napus]|uniref:Uncharacterized protein n=1 Tax=Brassica napus TaxID=3708 RepID=A0ABQ7Y4U4_BRANA|nr:hypothetical protein HID58_079467 [Brassica napus]